ALVLSPLRSPSPWILRAARHLSAFALELPPERLTKLLVHHLPARAVTSGLVASFPLKLAGVVPRICQHVFCCLGGANLLGSRPKLLKDFSRFFKRRGDRLPELKPLPT